MGGWNSGGKRNFSSTVTPYPSTRHAEKKEGVSLQSGTVCQVRSLSRWVGEVEGDFEGGEPLHFFWPQTFWQGRRSL